MRVTTCKVWGMKDIPEHYFALGTVILLTLFVML